MCPAEPSSSLRQSLVRWSVRTVPQGSVICVFKEGAAHNKRLEYISNRSPLVCISVVQRRAEAVFHPLNGGNLVAIAPQTEAFEFVGSIVAHIQNVVAGRTAMPVSAFHPLQTQGLRDIIRPARVRGLHAAAGDDRITCNCALRSLRSEADQLRLGQIPAA